MNAGAELTGRTRDVCLLTTGGLISVGLRATAIVTVDVMIGSRYALIRDSVLPRRGNAEDL